MQFRLQLRDFNDVCNDSTVNQCNLSFGGCPVKRLDNDRYNQPTTHQRRVSWYPPPYDDHSDFH